MSYSRSPARWLGPLAILAALAAIFAIVSATTGEDDSGGSSRQSSSAERRESGSKRQSTNEERQETTASTTPKTTRKTYTVKAGDTLAGIAETTGVPIAELQELNPGVDSNSLSIGQELRLAR